MPNNIPVFTISLDFELYWGIFDKVLLKERLEYFANTREVIPQMLALFEAQQVRVTWATVGMLFAKDWTEWSALIPAKSPTYSDRKLSAYRLKKEYESDNSLSNFFFAPELVEQIHNT